MASYGDRTGFQASFLQPGKRDGRVFLPELDRSLESAATRLSADAKAFVLHYHGYSVVMHKQRCLAIYSAANVDFSGRFSMPRPKDRWLTDPRIPADAQIGKDFYENNAFDRGHLTRREDMEYGRTRPEALVCAGDTCHWTNCTPQHNRFNTNRQLWQGIERHILEDAVSPQQFRAQVITGPVFTDADPVLEGFEKTPYPLRYWKVAAAINAAGKLSATAYILDQRPTIAEFGTRAAPAVPFGPYKTFQTTIAEIERLTKLRFTAGKGSKRVALAEFDPLAARPRARGAAAGDAYVELKSLRSITRT